MNPKPMILASALALCTTCIIPAESAAQSGANEPVTADNFIRAETDLYFGNFIRDGGFGKFAHNREPAAIDKQSVIRLNRDTLYSFAVFDLDAGPVTITLPDAGKRFMSMQVITQDHFVPMVTYRPGATTLTRAQIGTRYVAAGLRTLIDPDDPKDVQQVHALQDQVKVSQPGVGAFDVPDWDRASQKKVRDALLVLASTLHDSKRMFGTRADVDPVRHLLGTAAGWGGNPEKEATYLFGEPPRGDEKSIYKVTVGDVPVDGFWSISVYNAAGYFEKNPLNAYSINNITAQKSADGTITVQFGGCNGMNPNCLPITLGWNYAIRLYRPRAEILNGTWKFPEIMPAETGTIGRN